MKKPAEIIKLLKKLYPKASVELEYSNPIQLLAAVILSAQCTDVRVNKVTGELFKKYRTVKDFASVPQFELENDIRSTGFYRMKALAIRESARMIIERFGGRVPGTMDELLQLRGVARKTANVVLGSVFKTAAGIVVDTHVKRLSYRMGLTDQKDPVKIELDLMKAVPHKEWIWFGHAMVWHGRRVCNARSPNCPGCALNKICPKKGI